ncbi:MAG: hypothetical protein Kow00128_15720 [Deltaproteobacteria bacterium]
MMRLRNGALFLAVFAVIGLAAACSKPEAPKKEAPPPAVSAVEEGKALFEQKCSVCHGVDRATARKETKEKWASIVKEMQSKKADWISDADAEKIVEFLSAEHGKK